MIREGLKQVGRSGLQGLQLCFDHDDEKTTGNHRPLIGTWICPIANAPNEGLLFRTQRGPLQHQGPLDDLFPAAGFAGAPARCLAKNFAAFLEFKYDGILLATDSYCIFLSYVFCASSEHLHRNDRIKFDLPSFRTLI